MVLYISPRKILLKKLEFEKLMVYLYAEACQKHLTYNTHGKKKINGIKKTNILI